jgi:hypothetical protein
LNRSKPDVPARKGIFCPKCGELISGKVPKTATRKNGHASFTLYTRYRPGAVYRARRCFKCGHQCRTVERIESNRA